MKRILLAGLFILGWGVAQAQVAVVAPSLELQEAMNHAEQLQQMVQTYQTVSYTHLTLPTNSRV